MTKRLIPDRRCRRPGVELSDNKDLTPRAARPHSGDMNQRDSTAPVVETVEAGRWRPTMPGVAEHRTLVRQRRLVLVIPHGSHPVKPPSFWRRPVVHLARSTVKPKIGDGGRAGEITPGEVGRGDR